jgi:hypothetical protein
MDYQTAANHQAPLSDKTIQDMNFLYLYVLKMISRHITECEYVMQKQQKPWWEKGEAEEMEKL